MNETVNETIVVEKTITFGELEQKLYRLVCTLGCAILKNILENYDKYLIQTRDKKLYRHKGYKQTCIKTLMGEVEYKRAVYVVGKGKSKKHVYLLDDTINLECIGKISYNMAEKMLETTVNTISYSKGATEIQRLTNETISKQGLKNLVWEIGKTLDEKELEQVKLLKQEKLPQGTQETVALFEEADGLWVNLQGADRKEQIERYKKQCEKKNKEYTPLKKVKSELKLHMMYEGWKKDGKRHELVNKTYIAGFITPETLKKIRNAKVHQKYNEKNIKLRVMNGDGAGWIKGITTKETISQKDLFHIQQEIVRDVKEKEHQDNLMLLVNTKKYEKIPDYIENLKYETGGEEKAIKKLNTLKSYLREGLPRYQDIAKEKGQKIPTPPKDIEFRDMGTMESNIFSVLTVKLCSGRKAWSKKGATYMSKVCALYTENKGNITLEKVQSEIPIDNSVEEWINAIEENVKKNKKTFRANAIITEENNYFQSTLLEKTPELKELIKLAEFSDLKSNGKE